MLKHASHDKNVVNVSIKFYTYYIINMGNLCSKIKVCFNLGHDFYTVLVWKLYH